MDGCRISESGSLLDLGFGLSSAERNAQDLRALQQLFEHSKQRVPILQRIADEQEIERIEELDDVVPLLLPHTIFKSYPLSFIEKRDFARLTKWLSAFTGVDLRNFDCDGLASVDEWIDRLDAQTEMRLVHTFGTTGKLSLIPRVQEEWEVGALFVATCFREWHGRGPDVLRDHLPLVQFGYRHGANGAARIARTVTQKFAGGEHNSLALYPEGRFSADVAMFAAAPNATREATDGRSDLVSGLAHRRAELARQERQRQGRISEFFGEVQDRYAGKDVYLWAVWPTLHDWSEEGRQRGLRGLFGPGSILHTGGGTKGRDFGPGWRERILDFFGVHRCYEFYAMTEIVSACPRCDAGSYHIPSVIVPFVLDPRNGEAFPRRGRQTGRFAAVDLLARSTWMGVVTGDEVTMAGWDEPCACGRPGPYVEPQIRRVSAAEGGDDRITCGDAQRSHDRALEYLTHDALG